MRNSVFVFLVLASLMACKKEEKTNDISTSDVTGTTLVKGHVSKSVIIPDGSGGWTNGTIPAAAAQVAVTIKKSDLFPGSALQGADVYTANTDVNGNYSVEVKANASGVAALISIDGFSASLDTLINGVIKKGLYASYTGSSNNVTLFMGQNFVLDADLLATPLITDPNALKTGTAIVSGSVGITYFKETVIGSLPPFYNPIVVPYPAGHRVYLSFDMDPMSLAPRYYETTTDGNGYYQFVLSTVDAGSVGFNQIATIWVADLVETQDTIKMNNTVKKGIKGVFQSQTITQGALFSTAIRNASHLSYTAFVPD